MEPADIRKCSICNRRAFRVIEDISPNKDYWLCKRHFELTCLELALKGFEVEFASKGELTSLKVLMCDSIKACAMVYVKQPEL